MKYKYYIETESEKHFLYASEVAEFLKQNFGIVAETGKAHVKMVQALLEDFDRSIAEKNGMSYAKIYYNARNGLKRVYMSAPKILILVDQLFLSNSTMKISAGGKNFKYKIMEKQHE